MKNKDKRDDIEYMSDAEMEQLFEEINKDPEIRDVVPPPGMRDRVFQAIQNLEDRKNKKDKNI